MPKYDVFWTFVGNYAEFVVTDIEANDIEEAIRKSTLYSVDTKSDGGYKMKFIVWQHDVGLVHHGTIDEIKYKGRLMMTHRGYEPAPPTPYCKHLVGDWCHNPKYKGEPQENCGFYLYGKCSDCQDYEPKRGKKNAKF